MIRLENVNTMVGVIPKVYLKVDEIMLQNGVNGIYDLEVNTTVSFDIHGHEPLAEQVPQVRIKYDINSEVNAIKTAYDYLASIVSAEVCVRVTEDEYTTTKDVEEKETITE